MVKIDKKELRELLEAYYKLQALECGGVDNWEWYGASLQDYATSAGFKDFDELIEADTRFLLREYSEPKSTLLCPECGYPLRCMVSLGSDETISGFEERL